MAAKRNKKTENYYMGNQNVPAKGMEFEYTPEMAAEILKCSEDIIHFAENYFYILNLDEGRIKIPLYDAQKRILKGIETNRFYILLASRQVGKALALDTPIRTPYGWTTMGDLKVGDVVFGQDGNPCNVTRAYETRYNRPCYEVEFDNGEKIIADSEHNWFTQSKTERKRKNVCSGSVKTTEEIYKTLKNSSGEPNHRIPSCVFGIRLNEQQLKIPPYVLGMWLGDGMTNGSRITVGHRDIKETIDNLQKYDTQYTLTCKKHGINYLINMGMKSGRSGFGKETSLSQELKEMKLMGDKRIPFEYMNSSREQRLELLMGLMDSDGYIDKKGLAIFYNTNLNLAFQVKELIESLGYKTTYKTFIPTCNGIECSECAEIVFQPRELVCKLSFKANRIKINDINTPDSNKRNQWHYIKNITPVESVPVRCIEVDSPDHLFLAGKTLIPTHNSTIATIYLLWAALFQRDQKILLVANKESTAIEIFSRIRMAYEMLPNWLKCPVTEYGKTAMELENGSKISVSTTTGTAGRGSSCTLLFLDEAGHIERHILDDFYSSVFPIISSSKKAKVFMCSTPNGTGNLFHKIYTESTEGLNNWGNDKILWSDVPGRDEKWAEEIKAGLSDDLKWSQEFECTFLNTGTSGMSEQLYNKLREGLREPVETLMNGKYKIWELPNPDKIYIAGIDTSDGVGGDYSCIKILDVTDLREIIEVAEFYDNMTPVPEFTNICWDILSHWGRPICCIERNNQGGQVADRLAYDYGYGKLVSWGGKMAGRKSTQLIGMISQRNTKYNACANARYYYSDTQSVVFRNKDSLEELFKDFVKVNDTWQAASGKHDDRTMALVWALKVLDKDIVEEYFTLDEIDTCGKAVRISPLDNGVSYFENPTSIYNNEMVERIEESLLNPVVMGSLDFGEVDEITTLKSEGWQFIGGGDHYVDPSRNLSQEAWSSIDKWFG